MTTPSPQQIKEGYAVYTPFMLSIYDWAVIGFLGQLWHCPAHYYQAHYQTHITDNHLDVGVGTGYFLDNCRFSTQTPRIGLMDINPNSLNAAQRRIKRYTPEIYRQNILEPLQIQPHPFDSIGLNGLLHCLPGTIEEKSVVFDHLKTLMAPGAIIFGSTLVNQGITKNRLQGWALHRMNRLKVLHNTTDDPKDLEMALAQRFKESQVRVIGCMALFWAK
ncbi:MAG: class I SAM-dependent methyltransferase [Chloroflexota bacterium]